MLDGSLFDVCDAADTRDFRLATIRDLRPTHVKISQLVTSLQTSRQQDVFALPVPSLSTSCSKLVDNL